MFTRATLSGLFTLCLTSTSFAHGGHLGELAGHSHWIGVAALAGAALVAGLVAAKGKKKEDSDEAEIDGKDEDTAGETS